MIVAVSMFRNEGDVAKRVVEHLLAQGVNAVVVADNGSTDCTRMQLESVRGAVEIIDDPEVGYYQSEKMTRLAHHAMWLGADWIVPFDADEVWYGEGGRTIAESLARCTADVAVAFGYDHIARHDDPAGHPFDVIQWRRPHRQKLPKVAFRPHPTMKLAQGNHMVRHPGRIANDILCYRHFQYRSLSQMTAKVRNGTDAYKATDLPEHEGAHWRRLAELSDDELEAEWLRLCSTDDLVHDPAPVS